MDEQTLLKIDKNTLLFKKMMDDLPAMERKVFAGLLEIGSGTSNEIGIISRMPVSTVSAYMRRLRDRGLVFRQSKISAKAHIYEAIDSELFIWYNTRRSKFFRDANLCFLAFCAILPNSDAWPYTGSTLLRLKFAQRG